MSESEADVVVIGGGVVGASTTYHLAKAGRKVVLLERGSILSGCSSSTHAGINISAKEGDEYIRFSLEASRLYAELERELECDLEYSHRGSIALVVEKESDWEAVLRNTEELNRVPGVDAQVLRTPEAQRLEPALPSWIQGVVFCPVDGDINPFKLVSAYVGRARKLGAVVQTGTEVQGIEVKTGRVEAVVTSRGKIHTVWVVNAAGVDSPRIGQMVGVTIPVVQAQGQVVTTARVKRFLTYNLRGLTQTASGNLLVGTTKGFGGTDKATRLELIPTSIRTAVRLFPVLEGVPVARIWAGLRPWPLDGLPLLGQVSEVGGFLVATGHSGITLGEMIGRVMTELVVQGRTSANIHPYRPDRFKGDQMSYLMKMYRDLHRAEAQDRCMDRCAAR